MIHDELIQRAVNWLRNSQGCSVVFGELNIMGADYMPDAIGWKWQASLLVECKVSRADFFADRKKPIHLNPDGYPGQERVYLTPPGLVTAEELPDGWGLIEAHPNQIKTIRRPHRTQQFDRAPLNQQRSAAELFYLLACHRRHVGGEHEWDQKAARFRWLKRKAS